ncbi:MAG: helix-turn-helix transcriptional regulator [Phycisphaerae bacterium]|nr:helix-turn-helix transcriptional regulator [Phycisphaerae bacterium]
MLDTPISAARFVVDAVCKKFGAHVAVFGVFDDFLPGKTPQFAISIEGGEFSGRTSTVYQRYRDHDFVGDPFLLAIQNKCKLPVCLPRSALLSDREWFAHPHVQTIRRPAKVGECIYALTRIGRGGRSGRVAGIGWHRPWGEPAFSARTCAIASLLHSSLTGLYSRFAAEVNHTGVKLAPALERVRIALEGPETEKEIARNLRLSPHTVHGYAKQIYEVFGTVSRTSFLANRLVAARMKNEE